MATIVKKTKKGRPYYYAVECKRVGGKPRIVWQKYLGTLDAIIGRAEGAQPPKPKETVIFDAGGVAALLRIAQQLQLQQLIDEYAPKREQGPSVGQYILLAALNRALAPCSKLAIGNWYEKTVLRRLWGFEASAFSSQRFWDHMDRVSEDAIEKIQEQLVRRVQERFAVQSNVLLYDTTNFFTFLATTNHRAQMPQRGRNKQKRHDLRQIGLALVVSRDFQIPLLHKTYTGNIPDVKLFAEMSRDLLRHYAQLAGSCEATLVFDKGNVCDEGMENLMVPSVHFVSALPANRFPELLSTDAQCFVEVPGMPGTKAFTTNQMFCDVETQFIATYTESFFTQQLSGVTTNLVKCQKKLLDLVKALEKWHQGKAKGQRPTMKGVGKSVDNILSPQFMKDLFDIRIVQEDGLPKLSYCVDHAAFQQLVDCRLGRTLLVTDHLDWNAHDTIEVYRSLSGVEEAFKHMKNLDFLHWQPAYHWTDQKLCVHGFYCVLALLLSSIARKVCAQARIEMSLPALLEELSDIREVAVIYPPGTLAHPKDHITLSRMTPRQRKLADVLDIATALHQA